MKLDKKEFIAKLESSCTYMLNAIGIPMNYHRHTLRIAELKLQELFPDNNCTGPGAIPFGFLLGGTIINTIGAGEWDLDKFEKSESFFDIMIKVPHSSGTTVIYPMRSVMKYIKDSEKRLTTVLDTTEFMYIHTPEDVASMKKDEEGWITLKNGVMFRSIKQE